MTTSDYGSCGPPYLYNSPVQGESDGKGLWSMPREWVC